jgi:hypothetical protein
VVTLTASDNDGGTGVKKTQHSFNGTDWNTYSAPFTVNTEGTTTVYYRSIDKVGNVEGTKTQAINIDKTKPTIDGAATTLPNANGWYNTDVVVHFDASDALSGIDTVTPDSTITTEGANQSVIGTATDKAGNAATATVSGINIDKMPPVVTITAPIDSAYYQTATVPAPAYTAVDNLDPSPLVEVAGWSDAEGIQTMTVTATDAAGNVGSASVTYTVDNTPPTTTISLSGTLGNNGWYKSDVQVTLTATDNEGGTGVAKTEYSFDGTSWNTYSAPFTVSTEGTTTVYYRSIDKLGNVEATKTETVKIDKTPPTISGAATTSPNADGWYNTDVVVHFTASDSLSGIGTLTPDTTIATEGSNQSETGTATDVAGNSASITVDNINIDKTEPMLVFGDITPAPNAAGWNNNDVTIAYTASDNLSDIASSNPESPLSFTTEGVGLTQSVTIVDKAGNSATFASPAVNLDKTPPTISGAATTSPNADGWYNTDVVIHFTADDTLSGIDTVTPDVTISTEGAGQSASGTATDVAGNSATAIVSEINADKTPPVITINVPGDGASYLLSQVALANWTATDALSGISSATGTVPSGSAIATGTVGMKTFSATAIDNAGNVRTVTVTYYVRYTYSGILQPLNADGSSIFKLGSTVPVKFQLRDANGNFVTNAVAKIFITKISNGVTGDEIEAISTAAATTGNLFRYDFTSNQYIFNLATKPLSTGTWRIRIELDDGTSKYVTISLR